MTSAVAKEKTLESYLTDKVQKRGGACLKLNPKWFLGIPDRIVLLPRGVIAFVELKRSANYHFTERQLVVTQFLRGLGFKVYHPKTKDHVDMILGEL